MRTHDNPRSSDEVDAFLHSDVEGGLLVECQGCFATTFVAFVGPLYEEDVKCNGCGKFLVTHTWVEW